MALAFGSGALSDRISRPNTLHTQQIPSLLVTVCHPLAMCHPGLPGGVRTFGVGTTDLLLHFQQ